jgi:hypothetical protein
MGTAVAIKFLGRRDPRQAPSSPPLSLASIPPLPRSVCCSVELINSGAQHWPWYAYKHPANAVGNVMSISAVGGWGDRIFADE